MNIEQLIKKFYEGDTTPDEERLLMDYFLNEEKVDKRWKDDRQVFRLLHDQQIQVPAGVSGRLEEAMMQMVETSPQSLPLRRPLFYWISGAAAVALLCIGLFFTTRQPPTPTMADTFSDPEEAAIVAGQALALISTQLNKGLDMAAEAGQEFEKANQLLNKYLNK